MDTTEANRTPRSRWARLGWFVGIWAAGVAAMFVLAALIRFWIA